MPSFETENLKHVNGIASKILLLISMLICHFCYRTITALWYKAELKTRNIEWTRRWASYKVIQDLFFAKKYFLKDYTKFTRSEWSVGQIYRELGIQIFAQLFSQHFLLWHGLFVGLFKHHALLFLQSAHCSMVLWISTYYSLNIRLKRNKFDWIRIILMLWTLSLGDNNSVF